MDSGAFLNTWNPDNMQSDPTNRTPSIYDTDHQAHLYLTMTDGTTNQLRLIEGGYVGYAPPGWYFVKIPEDVFNAVYEACGGMY